MFSWLRRRIWRSDVRSAAGSAGAEALTPAEQDRLRSLAEVLKRHPQAKARLAASPRGSPSDFAAIRDYLIALGVEARQVTFPEAPDGTSRR